MLTINEQRVERVDSPLRPPLGSRARSVINEIGYARTVNSNACVYSGEKETISITSTLNPILIDAERVRFSISLFSLRLRERFVISIGDGKKPERFCSKRLK